MGRVTLIGRSGEFTNMQFPVEREITIGRNPRTCQVVFSGNAAGISGVHCRVEVRMDGIYLTDLNSTNGTFLENGTRLAANSSLKLASGQGFYLGDPSNAFYVKEEYSAGTPQPQMQQAQSAPPHLEGIPSIPPGYEPLSMWEYLGYTLLFSVPGIGFIFAILNSVNTNKNINLRNYARSYLCMFALAVILIIVWAFVVGSFIGGLTL